MQDSKTLESLHAAADRSLETLRLAERIARGERIELHPDVLVELARAYLDLLADRHERARAALEREARDPAIDVRELLCSLPEIDDLPKHIAPQFAALVRVLARCSADALASVALIPTINVADRMLLLNAARLFAEVAAPPTTTPTTPAAPAAPGAC